jgi:DNA-binding transcriptional ArsR family regulator
MSRPGAKASAAAQPAGRHQRQQALFAALADPVRRSLLANLADNSPRTATQLAGDYPITRQGVLKHLGILQAAGLVSARRHGRERRYQLTPAPLSDLEQWAREISAKWDARLLRLKAYVEDEQASG